MYQIAVLGILFALLLGGGYYITKSDDKSMISGTLLEEKSVQTDFIPTAENILGRYFCDRVSGCQSERTLNILSDGSVEMSTNNNEGIEISNDIEKGQWSIGGRNTILMSFNKTSGEGEESTTTTSTLFVQSVSSTTLAKISFDRNIYKDIKKPVFAKQE